MTVRVGLLDSGLGPEHRPLAAVYVPPNGSTFESARSDLTGHGADMARIILNLAPQTELLLAQIFGKDLTASPARVAAGLNWCVEQGANIVTMSLGLIHDEPALRAACARAAAAGLDLIAAAPPRGPAVYPAAYPKVIAVCGDARCAAADVSALEGDLADFGACNILPSSGRRGASCAAASLGGVLAAWRAGGGTGDAMLYLQSIARFKGRERRSGRRLDAEAGPV